MSGGGWPLCGLVGPSVARRLSRLRCSPGAWWLRGFGAGCAGLPGWAWAWFPRPRRRCCPLRRAGGVLWRLAPPCLPLPRRWARWLAFLAVGAYRPFFARWLRALRLALPPLAAPLWSVARVARMASCVPLFLLLWFSAPRPLVPVPLRSRPGLSPLSAPLRLAVPALVLLCFPPRLVPLVCCLPRARWLAFAGLALGRGRPLLSRLAWACAWWCSRAGFPRCRLGVRGVPWRVRGLAGFCWLSSCRAALLGGFFCPLL